MPILPVDRGEIYYEVTGRGYPVLLFAPGFLSSRIERWRSNPAKPGVPQDWRDPIPVLSRDFQVIALDVRNAGRSWAEIGPDYDWPSYTADHLKLLKKLGVKRCHVMGACIGVSFALAVAEARPGLVTAQVLQNPIGLSDANRGAIDEEIAQWAAGLASRPDVAPGALQAVGKRMFGGDFIFSVSRDFVGRCHIPTLLMPGDDRMHPAGISKELEDLTAAEVLAPWKGADHRDAAIERVRAFLLEYLPATAGERRSDG